jgi:SPP1 family phage portal protein
MELDELVTLVADVQTNYPKIKDKITSEKPTKDTSAYINQYDPSKHDITKTDKRPDKLIETNNGPGSVKVARLTIPMQKKIVNMAVAFLCARPVQLMATPDGSIQTDLLAMIDRTWIDNKLDFDTMLLAEKLMSETEVAEIWYTEDAAADYWKGTVMEGSKFRMRMQIIAKSTGDDLYPIYNQFGDMIAFGRGYQLKKDGKAVDHFDLYTESKIYLGVKESGGNTYTVEQKDNTLGKIPVIYYSQDAPEWQDVQTMIDRLEVVISNHADNNDYFSSPMLFVDGEIEGFAAKGEQGKVLQGKNGAKVEIISWDQAPDSVKLEFTNLYNLILYMTDTPDLSPENIKGREVPSGFALKILFMQAHLKAARKSGIVGKGLQRRLNLLKAGIAKICVKLEPGLPIQIAPQFTFFLPTNDKELVDMISEAFAGGFISRKTAVARNPLVTDPEAELQQILEEKGDPANIDDALTQP